MVEEEEDDDEDGADKTNRTTAVRCFFVDCMAVDAVVIFPSTSGRNVLDLRPRPLIEGGP